MHAEYKVPGGKLVVIDGERQGGGEGDRLRGTVLSGDFFLEPDEALETLTAALQDLPVDIALDELTARLTEAAEGAVLLGFAPRDIALTVLRALGRASSWFDHDFELIETGPLEPTMQMALEEVLGRQVAAGLRKPALRVWDWASNAVIIGSYQSVRNEVDLDGAAEHDVTVVRRVSGGGAMFVEPGNTITYSLYVPDTLVAGLSFQDSYGFLDAWVLRGFKSLGVDAFYAGLNDIASAQGKIGGAAQKRVKGGVIHHVTMAYDMDADKMLEVLRIGREKLSDKGTKSAAKRVDPVRSQTGRTREEVIAALLAEFEGSYGLTRTTLDAATRAEAEELARTKFANPEWLYRVP